MLENYNTVLHCVQHCELQHSLSVGRVLWFFGCDFWNASLWRDCGRGSSISAKFGTEKPPFSGNLGAQL